MHMYVHVGMPLRTPILFITLCFTFIGCASVKWDYIDYAPKTPTGNPAAALVQALEGNSNPGCLQETDVKETGFTIKTICDSGGVYQQSVRFDRFDGVDIKAAQRKELYKVFVYETGKDKPTLEWVFGDIRDAEEFVDALTYMSGQTGAAAQPAAEQETTLDL